MTETAVAPTEVGAGGVRVILAHDYLTQRGGAERVVLELARQFPDAPIVTSFYEPAGTFPEFGELAVRPSGASRWGTLRRDPRRAFPLLAPIFSTMQVPNGVVLCSSSGWAHGLRARGPKVVYCHNPARWLYQPEDYFAALPRPVRSALRHAFAPLRWWDRRAARSAQAYVANSSSVARRISGAYGIAARVVHPPAGLRPDGPWQPVAGLEPGFLLTVGRPRGYKNSRIVCEAVRRVPGARLVAVGGLPEREGGWGGRITEAVDVSDAQLRWLYGNCSAVVAMSHEDFGLTPVEGFSFGKPCIVLRAGGYLDSCREGVTGTFVDEASPEQLARAIAAFDPADFPAGAIREHAERFSPDAFGRQLREVLADVLRPR